MAWVRNRPVGLQYRDAAKSCPGYTLYCPVRGTTANLLDAEGRIVWRWRHEEGIQHAKLAPNGNLLIQTQPPEDADGAEQIGGSAGALIELDWHSKPLWQYRDPYQHHDYQRLPNGNTLVVAWRKLPDGVQERVQGGFHDPDDPERMWGDVVHEVAPDGSVIQEWRSWEHLSPDLSPAAPAPRSARAGRAESVRAPDAGPGPGTAVRTARPLSPLALSHLGGHGRGRRMARQLQHPT